MPRWTLAGIILISAGTLLLEVVLTRLFSIVQWYHFAFMAVGIGLLGFGASGTLLAVLSVLRSRPRQSAALAALGFAPAVGVVYASLLVVPFDAYVIALEPVQFAYLALQFVALVLPFLCAGLTVGGALAADPDQSGRIYGASLLGSGAGCLLAIGVLELVSAQSALLVAAGMGLAAASALWRLVVPRRATAMGLLGLALIIAAPLGPLPLRLSPYKALSLYQRFPDVRLVFSRSNAVTRVDAVQSAAIHLLPGLSYLYAGEIPPMYAVMVDGDAPGPVPGSTDGSVTAFLPSSAAYVLRRGRTLILGALGLEVLAAQHHGVLEVMVTEPNALIMRAATVLAPAVFLRPHVRNVVVDPRAIIRGATRRFAVIQLPARESFQVVVSGAFSLTEHYLYTVEAFVDYMGALTPDGVLVVTRWLQQPPSEEIKAWAAMAEALEGVGLQPSRHLAALRSLNTMTMLLSRQPWTPVDIARLRDFAARRRFDLAYAPGISARDANRFNVLPEDVYHAAFTAALNRDTRAQAAADSPFNIAPARDRRPFFFHFFRWEQVPVILASLGRTWQPFGGGGYLVLLGVLGATLGLSVGLILLPLRHLGAMPRGSGRIVAYFLLLGMGFMFVEIPLLQQFILLLGHPTYALSVVLFGILMSSGLGSLASVRFESRLPVVLLVLAIAAAGLAIWLDAIIRAALSFPLPVRIAAATGMLAIVGVPMGMPFVAGIRNLAPRPSLVPWAWAINGCASVVSSIGMIALDWGFPVVLGAAAAAYAVAGFLVPSLRRLSSTG